MIFKQGSCEQELFDSMQIAQQDAITAEDQKENKMILQAMQELNAAAESFERSGNKTRAVEVTQLMMSLANDDNPIEKKASNDDVRETFSFFGFSPDEVLL